MFPIRSVALSLALVLAAPAALAADPSIDKVNGSIDAEAGQHYGSLETVNGSIRIGAGATTGGATTVNGSIKAGDDVRTGDLETVNGGIHLGQRAQTGGIDTVNGEVFVDRGGRVGKDIATVNGAIGLVSTDLAGGISTVSGDVTVGAGSHVHGGLKVEKPNHGWFPTIHFGKQRPQRIVIGPNAVVDGEMVFERQVTLYVHDSARVGKVSGATVQHYSGDRPPQE